MNARRGLNLLAIVVFFAMRSTAQAPLDSKNVFGDLSADRLNAISESRKAARNELDEKSAVFDTPGIANALGAGFYLIVIARITQSSYPTTPLRERELRFMSNNS
jgi:hypothetical protein